MPTPSVNFNCFYYVLDILLSNRLGKAVPDTWPFPVCLHKCDRETGEGVLGLRGKRWDFVPAEASSPETQGGGSVASWASLLLGGGLGWAVLGAEGVAAKAGSPTSGTGVLRSGRVPAPGALPQQPAPGAQGDGAGGESSAGRNALPAGGSAVLLCGAAPFCARILIATKERFYLISTPLFSTGRSEKHFTCVAACLPTQLGGCCAGFKMGCEVLARRAQPRKG